MEETPIKAVEMVRAIRDRMYEQTRDMTPAEYLDFIAREAAKTKAGRRVDQPVVDRPAA
jgi:hypothetical protein